MFLEDLNSSFHGLMTASQGKICLALIDFLLKVFEILLVLWVVFCLLLPLLSPWTPGTYKQLQQRLQTTVNGLWKQVAWDFPSQPETHMKGLVKNISEWVSNWRQCSFLREGYSHLIFRVFGHPCILLTYCLPMLPVNVQTLMGPQSQSRISHCSR